MEMIDWKKLSTGGVDINFTFHRTKVPGGWFVAIHWQYSNAASITFYPDPEHKWDGNSLP
jgi:hypothetical protein